MPSEIDVAAVAAAHERLLALIGRNWVARKTKAAKQQVMSSGFVSPPAHPLIEWCVAYEEWYCDYQRNGQAAFSAFVLKLLLFERHLTLAAPYLPNPDAILHRIKQREDFAATAFELEVAAAYLIRGYQIEFLPTQPNRRTPDLKVTSADGLSFWVECKRRDEVPPEVEKQHIYWRTIAKNILVHLRDKAVNHEVEVTPLRKISRHNIPDVTRALLDSLDGHTSLATSDFKLRATMLDSEMRFSLVKFERYRSNPWIVAMLDGEITDQTDALLVASPNIVLVRFDDQATIHNLIETQFRSAFSQLPPEGPGVIWIALPDALLAVAGETAIETCDAYLRRELSGSHNQRVNLVHVVTWRFGELDLQGEPTPAYFRDGFTVQHENPRTSLNS